MRLNWTSHLQTDAEKEKFLGQVLGAKPVLNRLKEIIDEEVNGLDRSETDIKSFDNPNWAYKQAYKNGCRAAYSVLRNMANLDPKEK